MKTPDEIKLALRKCAGEECSKDCPCWTDCQVDGNMSAIYNDALDYIYKLETEPVADRITLNQYQALARRTQRDDLTTNMRREHALHLLAAEVGEIHSIYQKAYQGHGVDPEKVLDEAGDVLWGLAELMDALGYSMDDMARHNIDKLGARYPGGFDPERSLHREEGQ